MQQSGMSLELYCWVKKGVEIILSILVKLNLYQIKHVLHKLNF